MDQVTRYQVGAIMLGILLGLGLIGAFAVTPVTVNVNPLFGYEPYSGHAKVTVQQNVNNRALCIVWESQTGSVGSSCWELAGKDAPITHDYTLKGLSAGEYRVYAEVLQPDKRVMSNVTRVRVLSRFTDPDEEDDNR